MKSINQEEIKAVELKVEMEKPEYIRVNLEGIEGTNHLVDDDVIYTTADGEITAISIWGRTAIELGIRGIQRIVIKHNELNLYTQVNVYKTPLEVMEDARLIIGKKIGHANASHILDTPFYTINIKH